MVFFFFFLGYAWMVLFLLPFAHLVFSGRPGGYCAGRARRADSALFAGGAGLSLKVGESEKSLRVRKFGSQKDLRTFRHHLPTLVRIAILTLCCGLCSANAQAQSDMA